MWGRISAAAFTLSVALMSSVGAPMTAATARPHATPESATPRAVIGLNVPDTARWIESEAALGFKAGVVGVFADFAHQPDFPQAMAKQAADRGATLLVSWEPWDSWDGRAAQPKYQLSKIVRGDFDALLKRWGRQVAAFQRPVMIRFAPEMNGDWLPWSTGINGNAAGHYVAAWRHVRRVLDKVGAKNVRWVWNPIVETAGSVPLASVYPGARFVDWVALDGYNWGSTRSWGWQSYDDIFASSVASLKALASGKPWMIAEVGCAPGALKAAWIVDTLQRAQADGARAVVWFEFNKETDWRLSENEPTAAAARSVALSPQWLTGGSLALSQISR